jgi:phage FluMu gp28-like protein
VKLPKLRVEDTKDKEIKRHGDMAIALAMGDFAASSDAGNLVAPIPVTAGPGMTRQMMRGY